jgi:subtilisin family serine protease
VIDSGITPVPDLGINSLSLLPLNQPLLLQLLTLPNEVAPYMNGRIVYSQNFVPGQKDALDHYGHGTHVAGLIAGNGALSTGPQYFRTFSGAAPTPISSTCVFSTRTALAPIRPSSPPLKKRSRSRTHTTFASSISRLAAPSLKATHWIRSARRLKRPGRQASLLSWPRETTAAT